MSKILISSLFLVIGLILGFLICFQRGGLYRFAQACSDQAKKSLNLFPEINDPKPALFLIGDSHIKRGDWRYLESKYAVVNMGAGGSTISEASKTLSENIIIKDGTVLIWTGYNNISQRAALEDLERDYRKLLQLCRERELAVHVLALPETGGGNPQDRLAAIRVVNTSLEKITTEAGGFFYQVNSVLSNESGVQYGLTSDLGHLTLEGYNKIKPLLEDL